MAPIMKDFIRAFEEAFEHNGGIKYQPCLRVAAPLFERMRDEALAIVRSGDSSLVQEKGHVTYIVPTISTYLDSA